MGSVIDVSRNPAGLLDAVIAAEGGEEVLVERDGKLVAKLVPIPVDVRGPVRPIKGEAYLHALEKLSARIKAQPAIDPTAVAEDLYDENGLPR